MADNTKIEYAKVTWNPVTGCTPISEGCQNCYARRMANRFRGRFGYPNEDPFLPTFHPNRLDEPNKWRKPRRVFVCSMADLFQEAFINIVFFQLILRTARDNPKHTFLFLTKRIINAKEWTKKVIRITKQPDTYVWPNWMWLGVTTENQKRAHERIPVLLDIPAAVRWVSLEPLLGPVDLSLWTDKLQWVVVGAETGPGKRPMNLDWARSIRAQCLEAGVPFFFKKDSNGNHELDGQIWEQYPSVGCGG